MQSEDKIDRIFQALEELKSKVDNLSSGPVTSMQSTQESVPNAHRHSASGDNEEATTSNVELERQPSLLNHALFASRILKDRFGESSGSKELVRKMDSSLDKLHGVIESQRQQKTTLHTTYPHARTMLQAADLCDIRMPPVELSLESLQKAKGKFLI